MPHPFMQRDFPEIRRDKFELGVELSKTEFEAAALARPDPLEGAEAAATADMSKTCHPTCTPPSTSWPSAAPASSPSETAA